MKTILFISILILSKLTFAQKITFPDSLKAVGFYTEINMPKKVSFTSLQFGNSIISFHNNIKGTYFFASNNTAFTTVRNTKGQHKVKNGILEYVLSSSTNFIKNNIKILITSVKDSTSNQISFYIDTSTTNQWKYVGHIITNDTNYAQFFTSYNIKKDQTTSLQNTWINYQYKGWKAIDTIKNKIEPTFRPFRNIDSAAQSNKELMEIKDSLKQTATFYKGLYYTMLKEGTGQQVTENDEVEIFYKGWLYSNGRTFDETKNEPLKFPLKYLIKGWQIGVPICKVGGKIRLYIPSSLAYGIQNIGKEIPPNSTLVFDIEVISSKKSE